MTETFYDVLGVPEDASEEAITDAYRERVKEVHPDVSDREDAAEQFKIVSKAEEVLTDEVERQRYDRLGHETYMARQDAGVGGGGDAGSTDSGSSPGQDGFDNIRDAAAWARENTGRSGPTNRGADAGWRQREKQRYEPDSNEWNVGADDGWGVGRNEDDGDDGDGWSPSDEDWDIGGDGWEIGDRDIGGDDWSLGDDDWDLGANWSTDDESTGTGGTDRDWTRESENGSAGDESSGRNSGSRTDRSSSRDSGPSGRQTGASDFDPSWNGDRTAENGSETGSKSGFGAGDTDWTSRSSLTGSGPMSGKASTDGGGTAAANQSFQPSDPGFHSAEGRWGDDEDSYTVKEWGEQPDTSGDALNWLEFEHDNFGLLLGTFFMIPILLLTSVWTVFPLPFNVIIGICTLLVVGYLITRPQLGIVVFAPWAAVLPLGLWLSGLGLESPLFLSALLGTWVPLAYSVVIAISLNQ